MAPTTLDAEQGPLLLQICGGPRQGQIVPFHGLKCTIGSGPTCTHRIVARGVQPLHCLIVRGTAATIVRSISPQTRLNGRPFSDAVLRPGDRLGIGPIDFQVVCLQARNGQQTGSQSGPSTERRPTKPAHTHKGARTAREYPPLSSVGHAEPNGPPVHPVAVPPSDDTLAARSAELIARQAELDTRQSELDRCQAELEKHLRDLENRRAELEKQQAELTARQSDLDARQSALSARESDLESLRGDWEAQQAEIGIQQATLSARLAELESFRRDLESRAAALDQRQTALDQRQAALDDQLAARQSLSDGGQADREALDRRQEALDRLAAELSARDEELARRECMLQERHHQLESRLDELERREAELSQREAQFSQREAELSKREVELSHREASPAGVGEGAPPEVVGQQSPATEAPVFPWAKDLPTGQAEGSVGAPEAEPPESPWPSVAAEPSPPPSGPVDAETLFRHLGIRPPMDDEPEATAAAAAAGGATSTPPAKGAAEEESIDAYMARLLERLRQASGRGQADSRDSPETRSATYLASPDTLSNDQEARGGGASGWVESPEPGAVCSLHPARSRRPAMPKSAAPEDLSHLAAMRELANLSARNALDRHGRNMLRRAIRSKLAVLVLSFVAGSSLVALWWRLGAGDLAYYAALVCYLVAVVWGIQYAVLTGRLIVSRSGHLGWYSSSQLAQHVSQSAADPGTNPPKDEGSVVQEG